MDKKIICPVCNSQTGDVRIFRKGIANSVASPTCSYEITTANLEKPSNIYQCTNCDFVFVPVTNDIDNIRQAYRDFSDESYVAEEQGRRKAAQNVLQTISKCKSPGKLLEIGCAYGFFLDEAQKANWVVSGIELSKDAANFATTHFNLNIEQTSIEQANLPNSEFDVIVLLDVFEHLASPIDSLLKIRKALKDDGILYISTPNIDSLVSRVLRNKWWGINKFHLNYFSKKTLTNALAKAGFLVSKYPNNARYFSGQYIKERLKTFSYLRWLSFFISNNKLLKINLFDQVDVIATKKALMEDFATTKEKTTEIGKNENGKVVVVLPAYNAEKTLERTYNDIPKTTVDGIILVDDNSKDNTVDLARCLGVRVIKHEKNMGYGANQKTCYKSALEMGASIIVMVHPDYQYDPKLIPELIKPIQDGVADAVFGSRMLKGGALKGGMPLWKHNANILLTALENVVLGTFLTEYHCGFRAYSAKLLRSINFTANSDNFVFDTEIIVQALVKGFKIEEVPIQTRYFAEASSIKVMPSIVYGCGILWTMLKYLCHKKRIIQLKQFM